jgi:copper homeostasis protein
MLIEIIVMTLAEAVLAEKYGANRLELIDSFAHGGLSPDLELARSVCEAVTIPVNIMLRPHGNSFIYSKSDIKQTMAKLAYLRDHTQANGVVFGALDHDGNIDTQLLEQIIANLGHLSLTFHRAIDASFDVIRAYKTLLKYPEVTLVLTSGGAKTALEGIDNITHMLAIRQRARKSYAAILAGGGITPNNAKSIIDATQTKQIHLGQGVRENEVLEKRKFDQLLINFE